MENIRVIYDIDKLKIIDVVAAENTVTYTPHEAIQDTPDNCITALSALGIDTTPISDFISE